MKYFVPDNIEIFLQRSLKKRAESKKLLIKNIESLPSFVEKGQILVVFPDLRTTQMMFDQNILSQK